MRLFQKLEEKSVKCVGSKGHEVLRLRELQIDDFEELLVMQEHCLLKERELQQAGWSSRLDKNMLMRILVSGFILGLFNQQGQLVAYLPVYHLDPEQPVSHYAKQLTDWKRIGEELDLRKVAELKKPRVRPDYRGHHLGKEMIKVATEIILSYYAETQAIVMSLPTADIYSPINFLAVGFKSTGIITHNRAGEDRMIYLKDDLNLVAGVI